MRVNPSAEGFGANAVVLRCILDEDTPSRRTRTGQAWAVEVHRLLCVSLEIAHDRGGRVAEIGQRGLSVWFAADRAASAINCAIDLHEQLYGRQENPHLRHIALRSALGGGRAFFSTTPDGQPLLLGPAFERASDLAEHAPRWAILADTTLLQDNAGLDDVRSTVGRNVQRHGADYLGPVMQVRQDNHRVPISFHQIFWAKHLFESTSAAAPQVSGGPKDRLRGKVERWDSIRGHGFISSTDGAWYYTDPRYTVDSLHLEIGEDVFFVPRAPLQPGKNQVAGAVLALGHSAEGQVVSMPAGQPFGFIAVRDSMDSEQHILFRERDNKLWPIAVGTGVGFVVGENAQGAIATSAAPLDRFVARREESTPVSLRSLLEGFDQALARIDDRPMAEPSFGALFEALNWAVALDERIASQWAPRGRPLGMAWRREVEGADLLGVLRLLRNRLAHQWSDALTLVSHDREPEHHPQWRWRPFVEIKPGSTDPAAEAMYEQRFEGRPVSDALHTVRTPLAFVVGLMEPRPDAFAHR